MSIIKSCLACAMWLSLGGSSVFAGLADASCSGHLSTAPLVSFTFVINVNNVGTKYQKPPFYCGFSTGYLASHMKFIATDQGSMHFESNEAMNGFSCVQNNKDGSINTLPLTVAVLASVLPDDFKITKCKFRETPGTASASPINADGASHDKPHPPADSPLNLQSNERRLITEALQTSDGNTAQAAEKLGISEKALTRKMAVYKIGGGNQ